MKITKDELCLLFDALDALDASTSREQRDNDFFLSLISRSMPAEVADQLKAKRDLENAKLARNGLERREQTILLRAKLIAYRNEQESAAAQELIDQSKKPLPQAEYPVP